MSFLRPDGSTSWGVVQGDGVADLGDRAPTLRDALQNGTNLRAESAPLHPLASIKFLPPIPDPDKIICVGLNYLSHILEGGREPPKQPTIFTRWSNTQVGHMQPMIRPKASDHFDFEGEMAVVIGKSCRHVPKEDWQSVVVGYSCYNDGSIRDWQRHSSQFTPGKNFPGTGGFGPWIVTPDEVGDIGRQSLVTRLNGEEVQRATIDDLVFDTPALIAYCSTFTTLEPGDVIITGTTGGVGAYRDPPLWMKPGDTVEVEVSGVGILTNPIAAER
ncbi:MAG TPA: fumarylacetoacetate hydrolase family protein [Acetobacteraceae bacterium]|jgi:2-keto-4-pentenoate hydratase/2-oxohepta-3-ene-1,7-dioic acid hydratase in catechol pathway|nr:fumarylacetoacetate hydrolase family protein [Acetobacteraceae bacterium]